MSNSQRNALANLDAAISAIGTATDRFADRRQQGGFVAFATPGRLDVEVPVFAPASADMRPATPSRVAAVASPAVPKAQ